MRVHISMTDTLTKLVKGTVTVKDLTGPDVAFVFGCTRDYVLGDPERGPHELTWNTSEVLTVGEDAKVSLDRVPADLAQTWAQLRSAVQAAHDAGRVWWGLGRPEDQVENPFVDLDYLEQNYPAVAAKLTEQGHTVYYR